MKASGREREGGKKKKDERRKERNESKTESRK
jgi:hypothetical protein